MFVQSAFIDENQSIPPKISKYKRGCRLSTDGMNNKQLQKYCESLAGEVKLYNIKELKKN
jgi:hypothetical protein